MANASDVSNLAAIRYLLTDKLCLPIQNNLFALVNRVGCGRGRYVHHNNFELAIVRALKSDRLSAFNCLGFLLLWSRICREEGRYPCISDNG